MAYERRIIHYASDAATVIQTLSEKGVDSSRVKSAWFELLRNGGCGAGEIELRDSFRLRGDIEIGDFVALEYRSGDRWYFGRVEEVSEESPSVTRVSLYGMFGELNEVFPGGFANGDERAPHRYAYSDYFSFDPDWSYQSWNMVSQPEEIVQLLYDDYIDPHTHISLGPVESPDPPVGVQSLLFRGEESAAAILRQLAMTMSSSSFGVDENGALFLMRKRGTEIGEFQEGVDLESLSRRVDRSLLCNRLIITGDYIYGAPVESNGQTRGFYRFSATYRLPTSISVHGERRIRVHLPWIRRNEDARAFATEFFRVYGEPTTRYEIMARPPVDDDGNMSLLKPWLGQVRLKDRDGATLTVQQFDRIKVQFDHFPIFEITLGPEDIEFPEPPENSRWEVGPPQEAQPISNSIPPLSSDYASSSYFSESPVPSISLSDSSSNSSSHNPSSDEASSASDASSSSSSSANSSSESSSASSSVASSVESSGGGSSSGGGGSSGGDSSGSESSGGGGGSSSGGVGDPPFEGGLIIEDGA